MLQTWRLNAKDQNETHQRQAFDPETARPIVQQACNSCRVKKLRCSGEKTGCFRCQTLSQDCVYAQNTTRGSARSRKNKESISKASDDTRRSSISTTPSLVSSAPTPTTEAKPVSPRPEPFTSVPSAPSSELHWAQVRPGTNLDDAASLEIDMMPFESRDYLQMQDMSTVQMTGLETYQSGDTFLLSWPEPTQDSHLAHTKMPWEGAALPLSIPSFGGWEPGIHGYDETPLTPTTGNPLSESIIADIQTTPLPLPPQTVANGLDDCHWLQSQTPEPCQCFQRVVFLLEEIDSEALDTNVKELGPWLSRHKEALRYSEALLTCPLCQAKPEHMTILAFLTDRLIAICDNVVTAYLQTLEGGSSSSNHSTMGHRDGAWLVSVGNFEIDSPHEWSALVRTMLVMQLRGLDALMARFKDQLQSVGGDGVRRKADATQARILVLLEKLDPPPRDPAAGFVAPPPPCSTRSDAGR
ncbi:hypothetical protein ANO14919_055730 [Xylariales sp. No.14919]|nr:hypothetical protein ANO14919_055730 [Xylariales sp. No.14919]